MVDTSDNSDEVARGLAALGARVGAGMERALKRAGAQHQRTATKDLFTGYTGTSPADKLQTRSGALRRLIGWATRGSGFASELTIFAGPPARIQEYGGTIKAKRKKYLTIPLRAALTPSGVPKRPGARDWEDAFVLRSRAGKLFIARRRGKKGLDLLYKLQESVRLPARFGFRAHFRAKTIPFLQGELAKVLDGADGGGRA